MFLMGLGRNYFKVVKIGIFIIITIGFVSFFHINIFSKFFYVANEKCDDMITAKYRDVVGDYYIRNLDGIKISNITKDNLIFYETEIENELKKANSTLSGSVIEISLAEIFQNKDSLINWEIFKGKLTINSINQSILKKEQILLENGEMQDNLVFYGIVTYKISSGIFSRTYKTNVFFQVD